MLSLLLFFICTDKQHLRRDGNGMQFARMGMELMFGSFFIPSPSHPKNLKFPTNCAISSKFIVTFTTKVLACFTTNGVLRYEYVG